MSVIIPAAGFYLNSQHLPSSSLCFPLLVILNHSIFAGGTLFGDGQCKSAELLRRDLIDKGPSVENSSISTSNG